MMDQFAQHPHIGLRTRVAITASDHDNGLAPAVDAGVGQGLCETLNHQSND